MKPAIRNRVRQSQQMRMRYIVVACSIAAIVVAGVVMFSNVFHSEKAYAES